MPAPHRPIVYDYPEIDGQQAVVEGKWKLARTKVKFSPNRQTPWELYDLVADRNETTNLAGQYPGEVKRLDAVFQSQWTLNPDFPMQPPRGKAK